MEKVEALKILIKGESFVPKNKFPTSLKEPLFDFAMDCVHASQYDDNFFNLLENIFPYNKFTMTVSFTSLGRANALLRDSAEIGQTRDLSASYGRIDRTA